MTKADADPVVFHHNGQLVDVQTDEHGAPRMSVIYKDRFKSIIESRMDFLDGDGTRAALSDDVNNVFHRDRNNYPPLHGVIASPVFGPDMSLITEPGYYQGSGLMYRPRQGFEFPSVPMAPTPADVAEAVDDLLDVLSDFPLDGFTERGELIGAVKNGDDVPSLCHTLSAGLTPLCRAFINGPTPGHLARKDKPRTGATKLLSAISRMALLDGMAQPQSLPDSKAEVQKVIISSLDSGKPVTFFDNLPDAGKVDFGELASAMTAWPYYTGRRLGVSELVEAKVLTTWYFTGIRTQLSAELSARVLLINLDPKMERPEDRDGFKYDLDEHLKEHAPRYLHAMLVLVQNWIATGCKKWAGKPLGGFEQHSKIVGGILESAGIMGFLGNRDAMQAIGRVETQEDLLMDAMIEAKYAPQSGKTDRPRKTVFRIWGEEPTTRTEKTEDGVKDAPFKDARVVSIKSLLELDGIALHNTNYLKDGDGGVSYPKAAKPALTSRFGGMVGAVRERTADSVGEGEEGRVGRHIIKRVGTDKHGTFYELAHLPLVWATQESGDVKVPDAA